MLCMGCMREQPDGVITCPQCEYPAVGINPAAYLPVRTVLDGRYLIGRVLETGGDSAVYIGLDKTDNSRVTIREFFPPQLAERHVNGVTVQATQDNDAAFEQCRTKFLALARAMARLRDVLVVVPSYDIFEANGTAYSVSEYCDGTSLEKYVAKHGGALPVDDVRRMFLPLIAALNTIHGAGVLHLALSPKNILVDDEGHLRLKNFAIAEMRTACGIGRPGRVAGCAAPEQYENGATCTAAADVYGLAASMVFALTGQLPAEATVRVKKGDTLALPADIAESVPPYIKDSLQRALRVSAAERTQTAQQLLDELSATQAVASLRETEEEPVTKKKRFPYWLIIFIAVLAAGSILLVFALNGLGIIHLGKKQTTTTTTQPSLTMKPTTSTSDIGTLPTGSALFEVDDFSNQTWEAVKAKKLRGDMKAVLVGYKYSETVPKGTIVEQSPAAGEKVKRGTKVEVIISAGSAEVKMPDVSGWKEEHARIYLEALGFTISESLLQQSECKYEKGLVESSIPAPGTTMKVGDTIRLYVSNVEAQPDITPPPAETPVDTPVEE